MSLWADNMLIPNLATHQSNAEEWINYYYDPEVAAKLADWNYYICPVEGAQEEMLKLDKPAAKSQLIFPDRRDAREHLGLHGAQRPAGDRIRKGLGRCHIWLSTPRPPVGRERHRRAWSSAA